jgi:isochorismate synthase EntC
MCAQKEAAALDKTAASLRTLAETMSGNKFVATPERLATIAKQLSLVSDALAGSAEKQEAE